MLLIFNDTGNVFYYFFLQESGMYCAPLKVYVMTD